MPQRFTIQEDGRTYRLSDGTELRFLERDGDLVEGLSVEEMLGVLIHRLEVLRKRQPPAGRFLSLAITELEAADNWMNRWDDARKVLVTA